MEFIDEVDENDNLTGAVFEKEYVHENCIYHREVKLWIMNEDNKLLMLKRTESNKQFPNYWCVTAGYVDTQETPVQAAIRKAKKELGIEVTESDLEFICKTRDERKNNYIFEYQYFLRTNLKERDFTIQKDEFSKTKFIALEDLENNKYPNGDNSVLSTYKHFELIMKELKNRVK
jgi:isopentenyldiphosphate isomerase